MGEFRMPSLGADMEHGKVVEWLVKPGDYVHRGDVIAEVDTEKTVMEIETFEEGVIAEFLVELGETVPVGTPLAVITGTPADRPPAPSVAETAPKPEMPHPEASAEPSPHPGEATPPVRRLAHELGVDLAQVHGTGHHGAITRADVEAAAEHPKPPVAPAAAPQGRTRSTPRARRLAAERGIDLGGVHGTGPGGAVVSADLATVSSPTPPPAPAAPAPAAPAPAEAAPAEPPRAEPAPTSTRAPHAAGEDEGADRVAKLHRAVGGLMARSKREIPHYYLSTTIDLSAAMQWMQRANADRPLSKRLVPAALLLAATAKAAKTVPDVNGFFVDDAFQPSDAVHLGVAVAMRGGGLIAPAIHDADSLSVDEVMERLRDLVARARAGRLQRAEMADPTITVTNLGDLGVESIFGVIYPPQVALIGFGRVVERAVVRDGMIGIHPTVVATLSADHRASDGLVGGRVLARIDELLQKPEEL